MNILALDTCTEACSAAFLYNDTLYEQTVMTQRGHSELVLGLIDAVLAEANATLADVEVLAYGRGPGSFTGVRVCVSVAQGIAFARELPVVGISTLAAVAQDIIETRTSDYIAVAMDARMGEVYGASFQVINEQLVLLDEERVCPPEEFIPHSNQEWCCVGTAWSEYEDVLQKNFSGQSSQISAAHYPIAANIIRLAQTEIKAGNTVSAEQALPVYLRNNVAKKKAEQGA